MKNEHLWQPTRVVQDSKTGQFLYNKRVVYAGSGHIAALQVKNYVPLIRQYCTGRLLDCGCGRVPYYEVYRERTDSIYCIDWSDKPEVIQHVDEHVDLNEPFELRSRPFDSILLADVIAHVSHPDILVQTLSRHLAPGGHLVITTPFVYWISEYPDEYFHPTDTALRMMCKEARLVVVYLEPYGGHPDVLLDTLNKAMTSSMTNRLFRMLASVVKKSSWYKKHNAKSRYSYPLGYTLVARK